MAKRVIELRSAFNYDTDAVSDECGFRCEGESLAQQQFAEECDINTIVKRFGITGMLPQTVNMPISGDFTAVGDFRSAVDMVRRAEEEFMRLPAEVRARFHNDPQEIIAFIEDGSNREEARKLGLLAPVAEVTRDVVDSSGGVVPSKE